MNLTLQDIEDKKNQLSFQNLAFINGSYTPASSQKTFECISPIDGRKLTDIASCDEIDVNIAVKNARQAFDAGVWSTQSPSDRKKILLKFADLIDQHQLELAVLETLDMGKPIQDSYQNDVPGAANRIRWVAEAIDKVYDQIAPTANHILAMVTHEPCGVVAAVTPWNFPLYLACAKIAPALATGNSIVIKPAEQSPLTTIRIAELAVEAGIPPGVFNVLPGYGESAGQALGRHPDIDVVSFTGSTEVGKFFLKYSAESNMKRIFLECGGKSPNIVMSDCSDLTAAAKAAARGVFHNQGEVCCAPTRLLVQRPVKDELLEKIKEMAQQYQPDNPLHPNTQMGAIVDNTQLKRILEYINSGHTAGAELILGGQQTRQDCGGYYIEPTIFDRVQNHMKIAQEEIFGPVLSVFSFDEMTEALQLANDTTYGLAASVWTQNIDQAHFMARALRAGSVSVNCVNTGDNTTPFGGYKQSGIGREGSLQEFNNYTELKTTWIELQR